ncbi:hypothetical protein LJC61_05255 [Ruminococcaceae bacterium OttesenSCG-928-A16]|nr:hypothetical protein [Ruminococcaceae bacterium OttesenSCG-928-A16]
MLKGKINLSERTDLSNFLVHLTRDSPESSAKESLISILNAQKIEARNHHCLFKKSLEKEPLDFQKKFYVTCYTETPLDKIKHLTKKIENRNKKFQPYGLVFIKSNQKKSEKGSENAPNPVFYAMGNNGFLIRALFSEFDQYLEDFENGNPNNFNLIGSLVNIVNENHNFQWEREWRTVGDYEFLIPELAAVIAPSSEHSDIRSKVNYYFADAITFIDIDWNMEQILLHIGAQSWNNWHEYYQLANPILEE